MINRTPIKRSPHIVSLSKDHHHALLLIWKIREGIKHQADIKRIISYALYFYNNFLKTHFREEENYLFCLLPDNDKARMQAFSEHELIKPLFEKLDANTCTYPHLSKIAGILEDHIRFEERLLFPHLEKSCSEAQLEQTAVQMANIHQPIVEQWDDQFWKK